jgi:hypothetical protein
MKRRHQAPFFWHIFSFKKTRITYSEKSTNQRKKIIRINSVYPYPNLLNVKPENMNGIAPTNIKISEKSKRLSLIIWLIIRLEFFMPYLQITDFS